MSRTFRVRIKSVDLRELDNSPAKWTYLGTNNGNSSTSRKTKKRKLFYALGRRCCKWRVHWRKLRVWSLVTFYWLSYGSPPPIGWAVTGWGGIFSTSFRGSKVVSLPALSFPVGVLLWVKWHLCETSFFQPPDSILNEDFVR